jgi:hypothetical protein
LRKVPDSAWLRVAVVPVGRVNESCVVVTKTVKLSVIPARTVAVPVMSSVVPAAVEELVEVMPVSETPLPEVSNPFPTVMPSGLGLVSKGPPSRTAAKAVVVDVVLSVMTTRMP